MTAMIATLTPPKGYNYGAVYLAVIQTKAFHTTMVTSFIIGQILAISALFGNILTVIIMRKPTFRHSNTSLYFITNAGTGG